MTDTQKTTGQEPEITEQSKALFVAYAEDSANWNGTPLVGGNVCLISEKADRGNLTQLKRAGLVRTFTEDKCTWLEFTEAGRAYAEALGFEQHHGSFYRKAKEIEAQEPRASAEEIEGPQPEESRAHALNLLHAQIDARIDCTYPDNAMRAAVMTTEEREQMARLMNEPGAPLVHHEMTGPMAGQVACGATAEEIKRKDEASAHYGYWPEKEMWKACPECARLWSEAGQEIKREQEVRRETCADCKTTRPVASLREINLGEWLCKDADACKSTIRAQARGNRQPKPGAVYLESALRTAYDAAMIEKAANGPDCAYSRLMSIVSSIKSFADAAGYDVSVIVDHWEK